MHLSCPSKNPPKKFVYYFCDGFEMMTTILVCEDVGTMKHEISNVYYILNQWCAVKLLAYYK
jgi:hypothetical protein